MPGEVHAEAERARRGADSFVDARESVGLMVDGPDERQARPLEPFKTWATSRLFFLLTNSPSLGEAFSSSTPSAFTQASVPAGARASTQDDTYLSAKGSAG